MNDGKGESDVIVSVNRQEIRRTDEDTTETRLASLLVRQPALVGFETRETNGHLGHDTGENSAETLVKREGCLTLDDVGASRNEAPRLGLYRIS